MLSLYPWWSFSIGLALLLLADLLHFDVISKDVLLGPFLGESLLSTSLMAPSEFPRCFLPFIILKKRRNLVTTSSPSLL